ncbi:uncharacterized protein LOC116015048 [Ipomoea triloba]|uniref:uncharacterized protein LOC116015040 n=1 Tax=Ipomoea triloba TaxID=35885 RepID=UPI00125DB4DC|nr:uncharacterized protein LOC116015040 [Ipomoea triloba]XP_031110903.1 uncharacterized protein LOC116015048 [Ipomoea triloba]
MPPRRDTAVNRSGNGGNEANAPTNAQLAHGLQQLTQLTQTLGATLLQNGNGNDVAKKKVEAAVYYLQQEAVIWWANNGHVLRQQPDFDWEAFKTAMRDRFYPEHVKATMYEEFLHLKQGNLSVQEYHAKFLELARFASKLVPDEVSKAEKFIRGLTFGIQKVICVLGCQTLNEAYKKAANLYRVELIQREANVKSRRRMESNEEENKQGDKRPRFNNQGSNKGFQNNKGNAGYRGDNRQGNQGQKHNGTEKYHYCKRCGNGHPGKDCQGNLVKCFKCQKMGHRAYECHLELNGNNQATDNGGQNTNDGKNNRGRIFVMSRAQAEASGVVSRDVV